MGNSVHKKKYGQNVVGASIYNENYAEKYKSTNDKGEIITTYWRAKNPKITKVKYKDLVMSNHYDFGRQAPKRVKNFSWLRKDHRTDWFGVKGKDFDKNDNNF